MGTKINPKKQVTHMKSTVRSGASFLEDHVDVQALFDNYAGTGRRFRSYSKGDNIEEIMIKGLTSSFVNRDGAILPANVIKIDHSE